VRHVPTVALSADAHHALRDELRNPTQSDSSAVREVETRLRSLGASGYQLQQASDGRYRFVCSYENDRGEQQTFESTSPDRLQAMLTVLDQVSAWHAGQMASVPRSAYGR
jgi:hypothetical protein